MRKELLGDQAFGHNQSNIQPGSNLPSDGQLPKATEMKEEVLRMRKELLGDQHLDSIAAAASLAVTYYNQECYPDARDLELEVYRLCKEILGGGSSKDTPGYEQSSRYIFCTWL